ncbi:hypothetical protein AAGV28_07215 [Flavobacterium sp. FZUC8N2.13]|uniref:Uncharacterized protein n=1 Tax=Flavobacterium zubiriense TaxID=3138075 RepID=A0ABV4TAM9_9FLAO
MLKENVNEKLSHRDVFPALAKFVDSAYFQGEIQNLEKNVQEPFELLLVTEFGDSRDLRERMHQAIETIRGFARVFEPFTNKQVEKACQELIHV